jgi:hypothetical protein
VRLLGVKRCDSKESGGVSAKSSIGAEEEAENSGSSDKGVTRE